MTLPGGHCGVQPSSGSATLRFDGPNRTCIPPRGERGNAGVLLSRHPCSLDLSSGRLHVVEEAIRGKE